TKSVSLPRQVVMWLAREETALSLEEVGDHFGGRDHTTVLYATTKIGERIASDDAFRTLVERIRDRVRAHGRSGTGRPQRRAPWNPLPGKGLHLSLHRSQSLVAEDRDVPGNGAPQRPGPPRDLGSRWTFR